MPFESLLSILTRENITLALAVLGFMGTLISAICALWNRRRKISVDVRDYAYRQNLIQLLVFLENQSSLPLIISSVEIKIGEGKKECELLPKKITKRDEILYRSPMFPINLPAHVGASYFFVFLDSPDIGLAPGKNLFLVIHTNRGEINKTVSCGHMGHYLHFQTLQ